MRVLLPAAALSAVLAGPVALAAAGPAAADPTPRPTAPDPAMTVTYPRLALPDGRYARVYADGVAEVTDPARGVTGFVHVPLRRTDTDLAGALPPRDQLLADLTAAPAAGYADHEVLVAYSSAAPSSAALARVGADRADQLSSSDEGGGTFDLTKVYRLHLAGTSVPDAVAKLRADPAVAYASPNWRVVPLHTDPVPVPATAALRPADRTPPPPQDPALPANYALTASAQSLLNRPGVDAVPAYAALAAKYGQLPGHGEIITNVSLGGLDDQAAVDDAKNACHNWAAAYGPSTIVQDGQRYLDWPSMPLIPTYTADKHGRLDPLGQVCGADDPGLVEVGLDFSMMAPLPHDQQRAGRTGDGLSDLLGIAPGASYRLVEPDTAGPTTADVDAAFLAAARQRPKPSVITASLAFGYDGAGFPGRSLEDDPLTAAVLSRIVHHDHIVVCLSGGDGVRQFTNAAIAPAGGSAATERARPGQPVTSLDDVGYSTVASVDPDTGAIDVGATTLDDVVSAPPHYPGNAAVAAQQAYPAVRYNGARNYASAYGSRLDLSAPGDNVLALSHAPGGGPADIQMVYNGGTSASAPEVAAAAAVVLQVAKLTGDHRLAGDPLAVRDLLARTGAPVPVVPQSDTDNHVGPQVDVGRAVESLLASAGGAGKADFPGQPVAAGVARVGVVQRVSDRLSGSFTSATDPGLLPLDHGHLHDWITIAPDWVGLPASGVTYALTAGTATLATTPTARLLPATILAAAGLPLAATDNRTVALTYTASRAGTVLASVPVTLTFGPSDGLASYSLAPQVPAVVRGADIPVGYDLSDVANLNNPVLVVSEPGRVDPVSGAYFRAAYQLPLTAKAGTVHVPVSALQGGGIYGIGVESGPAGNGSTLYSTFAYTRVAPSGDSRPAAPLLSAGHYAEIPYHGRFTVSWDVRGVPGADGAALEISAAGPTMNSNQNPFNNPNGTERDHNGFDRGSLLYTALRGSHGSVTLDADEVGLYPTMTHAVRVLATRHGTPTGTASEVSTIARDGVVPSDGGSVTGGFGVNAHGGDGFLTSNGTDTKGRPRGSVEVFDQRSATVTRTASSSRDFYQTGGGIGGGPGVFAGDTGLYQRFDADNTETDHLLRPVTSARGPTWHPPAGTTGNLPAPNQDNSATAVLSGANGPTGNYQVFTADLAAGTTGPLRPVAPALAGFAFPFVTGFGQDTGLGLGVVGASDFFTSDAPPTIVTVDLATGKLDSFPGVGQGSPSGLAVDSADHLALSPSDTSNTLGLYDLLTHHGTELTTGGGFAEHPAADPTHHLFAIQELLSPDGMGGVPADNNAQSSITILDTHGTVTARLEAFNFFNTFLPINGSYVQLNPSTRTGWTLGPGGYQLTPFHY